jgi:hypothetical protein
MQKLLQTIAVYIILMMVAYQYRWEGWAVLAVILAWNLLVLFANRDRD